ncbi:MAG: hypothetical protein ACOX9C_08100 [Kiritimatiellia bacterium]
MSEPFILLRQMSSAHHDADFLRILFETLDEHPGTVDEIWFCSNARRGTDEAMQAEIAPLQRIAEACRKRGIRFALQQGVTLGHAMTGDLAAAGEATFPDDAWCVLNDGGLARGLFCPNSPVARDFLQKEAELFMAALRPASYWPDDDFRLGYSKPEGCFCPRCLARFREFLASADSACQAPGVPPPADREDLVARLYGEGADAATAALRRDWTTFVADSLGACAAAFRRAADATNPDCLLGIQAVSSRDVYNGADGLLPVLKVFSGSEGRPVGIRPGSEYYSDVTPTDMLGKCVDVAREAARVRRAGVVGPICYEAENYPHVSSLKTPGAQMTECALALFSGCDSLAIYWHDSTKREPDENYRFYMDAVAAHRPFFETIRDATAGTSLAGIALHRGADRYRGETWRVLPRDAELPFQRNALPVAVQEAAPEVLAFTKETVEELAQEEIPIVFSGPVLMDADAVHRLVERFPRFASLDEAASGAFDVRTVPTEFGGAVVIAPDFYAWTTARRAAVLDALDGAAAKPLAVRLLTGGFAVAVLGRIDEKGRTKSAFLLNLSIGPTPRLRLALRNPASADFVLERPLQPPAVCDVVSRTPGEIVLDLPPLAPWQPALLRG